MTGPIETLSTFNSVVRTILAGVVVTAVAGGGWWGYRTLEAGKQESRLRDEALDEARLELEQQTRLLAEKDRLLASNERELIDKAERIRAQTTEIASLEEDVRENERRIEQLETAMHLLKVDQRLARLTVLDQSAEPDTGRLFSKVEFVELDERGEPMDEPRVFSIKGSVVYVDNWVVKFDEHYVEEADELRATSLVLFRRIFGEYQEPTDGYQLDRVGVRPKAYSRGAPLSDFEQKIWGDFWQIANDPRRAAELGIRAAHGEAVSMKVQKGKRYRLILRSSDGLSIVPEKDPRPQPAT
ncbi:MAG: hypothetical protein ACYS0G_13715 [Planctomycetota bacterium]|jgi:hypothetical protein